MAQALLVTAAGLTVAIAIAHSYLGERYLLMRLFRLELPALLGSDRFTKRTLRFAWHVTSVAWLGFAALLVLVGFEAADPRRIALGATSAMFLVTGLVTAVASRGRHLSWMAFFAIAVLVQLSI